MNFRPCIDLHRGVVKQIVGSTLSGDGENPEVNFTSDRPVSWYVEQYKKHNFTDGHVIRLGEGNDQAAAEALSHWPGALQLGGGVNADNAVKWLKAGAKALIVTSYVFKDGQIYEKNLRKIAALTGKKKLTLDLSCRKKDGKHIIVTDRWQKFTDIEVTHELLNYFSQYCGEFLIHGVDVEGKSDGVEKELVEYLGKWGKAPITYAGGVRDWEDIKLIYKLGRNKIDFTVGSALDIFGGKSLKYEELATNIKKYP